MKRTLQVLGAVFGVLLLCLVAAFVYMARVGSGLDSSSKAYVDEALPAIVSSWSKQELVKRASPQLMDVLGQRPEELDKLFNKLSRLGALKTYNGCSGESKIFVDATKGKSITAEYTANVVFENGEATFNVRLLQTNGQWEFLKFTVRSPIFYE